MYFKLQQVLAPLSRSDKIHRCLRDTTPGQSSIMRQETFTSVFAVPYGCGNPNINHDLPRGPQ
jgi:hypothetical protein